MIIDLTSSKKDNNTNISQREFQILQLIVNEFTDKEIASKLFISSQTVATHRKNMRDKLSARNTAGLVRRSLELGLIRLSQNY